MIILHQSAPSSMLKAAMLYRLYKGLCMHYDEFSAGLLKNSSDNRTINVDGFNIHAVRSKYESRFGPVAWLDSRKSRQLSTAAFYAARYHAADRYRLVVEVMSQALERGLDYVLSRVSPESRSMMNRSRRICMELHRAYGFIRLEPMHLPGSGPVFVGKAKFENDIADLVLRHFSRRTARQKVYLIAGDQVLFLEGSKVRIKDAGDISFLTPGESFAEMWEAYYDSQFIEGRKNPDLAKKHLPKKYWSWVPEGQKLE